MADVGLKDLLQAGVHFGHQTSRWNPKMRRYIFAERGGIYLLDLKKTLRQLDRAREHIREAVDAGRSILFVCTKPQLREIVETEAGRCGAFYVTERWVGGLLTNFQTIKGNIRRLKELEQGLEEGHFDHYTKKEQILLDRERQKLQRYLEGIKDMTSLPGLVFVVDAKREEIAVKEAHRLEIPIVAIADTNADPDLLDIPIPGNDDAIRAVSLITRAIADEVALARSERPESQAATMEGTYTYSSDVGETEDAEPARRKSKRPRARRRPKPEVIARKRQGREKDGTEAPEAGEAPEAEADGTPGAAAPIADKTAPEAAADADAGPEGEEEDPEDGDAPAGAGRTESGDTEAEEEADDDADREEVPVSAAAGDPEEEKESS